MNPNANIPAGSEHDPRAPYNEPERYLCPRCDKDEINELWAAIEEKTIDEMSDDGDLTQDQCDQIQMMEDEFRAGFRVCKNCGI